MTKHIVYISPAHMDPSYQLEREGLGPDVELRMWSATDPSDLVAEIADADAIMTWRVPLPAQVIDGLRRCKVIVRFGVGFDIVDVEAARARNIPVCNIPDYCTDEVADHTMGLLLALNRQIVTFNNNVHRGNEGWTWAGAGKLNRIAGSTLGVIGLGRIGTAVSLRAKSFGMNVVSDLLVPALHSLCPSRARAPLKRS